MFRKFVFFSLRLLAVLLLLSLFAGAILFVSGAPQRSFHTGYAQGYADGVYAAGVSSSGDSAAGASTADGAQAGAPAASVLPPAGAPFYPPLPAPVFYGPHYGMPFFPLLVCLGGLLFLPLIFFIFRPPWRHAHAWHGAPPWGSPNDPHTAWRGAPPPWGCPSWGNPSWGSQLGQEKPSEAPVPSEPRPRPE